MGRTARKNEVDAAQRRVIDESWDGISSVQKSTSKEYACIGRYACGQLRHNNSATGWMFCASACGARRPRTAKNIRAFNPTPSADSPQEAGGSPSNELSLDLGGVNK